LWDKFGEDLYNILSEGDITLLSTVLSEPTARKLAQRWRTRSDEADVLRYLSHYGFDLRLANKIRRVWPENAINKLQENPYRMLSFAGWSSVDSAARAMGVERDDLRRQVAAVEGYLYRRLEEKHTVTPREILLGGVSEMLSTCSDRASQRAIDHALAARAITPLRECFQPVGAAVMERSVEERFKAMLGDAQLELFPPYIDAISGKINDFEKCYNLELNAEQKAAVGMAVTRRLSVLTGGAGVGKTLTLKAVDHILKHDGRPVIQMALSGRAANRIRETTGEEAYTIAAFLRAAAEGKFDAEREPLVIVDEASMIDLPLAFSILRSVPSSASLLFVGDPYQLPPIGFGLVFHILARSPNVPRTELIHIHRQARDSGIPQIAQAVRHGLIPELSEFQGVALGVTFTEAAESEMLGALNVIVDELSSCGEVQVLGVTKRRQNGVQAINAMFHNRHLRLRKKVEGSDLAEGDPVIYLVNDYKKGLWNGSLGKIKAIPDAEDGKAVQSILCMFDGIEHRVPAEDFNNIELAYAITVHKAQGSQFERVVIPITKTRLLDRTLIYTALTRGVKQVVFIGDRDSFSRAITSKPKSQERMVGFSI
jgi:exodeoxyribonuclease V alpha subunit